MKSYLCQVVKVTPISIVGHAILPNETDIVGSIMYGFVLPLIDLLFDEAEVHGFFYDLGIVEEAEGLPVDGLSEWFCEVMTNKGVCESTVRESVMYSML